jgi:hypothetical protein
MENEIMRDTKFILETSSGRGLNWMVVLAVSALLVVGCAGLSFAQESKPKTFSSPGEACHALYQAVQSENEQGVDAILGTGTEITSSSDKAEDKLEHERFTQKYEQMHRLVQEPDGHTVLYIGAENWPFPIPLVSKNGAWSFDPDAGTQEITFRTVGENEATAIQVCHALVTAENEHGTPTTGDDSVNHYAQALATAGTASAPFHGYYFRMVTANPPAGSSGYASSGKKKGGLVLIAYPVEYRSSGVMTFIVNQKGVVYEKDLGPDTEKVARDLNQRSRGSKWHVAE